MLDGEGERSAPVRNLLLLAHLPRQLNPNRCRRAAPDAPGTIASSLATSARRSWHDALQRAGRELFGLGAFDWCGCVADEGGVQIYGRSAREPLNAFAVTRIYERCAAERLLNCAAVASVSPGGQSGAGDGDAESLCRSRDVRKRSPTAHEHEPHTIARTIHEFVCECSSAEAMSFTTFHHLFHYTQPTHSPTRRHQDQSYLFQIFHLKNKNKGIFLFPSIRQIEPANR